MKHELSKELAYKVNSNEEKLEFLKFIKSKGFETSSIYGYVKSSWECIRWDGNDFRLGSNKSIKYPIVDCKDVIGFKDDVFVLPEKWCVCPKTEKNLQIISDCGYFGEKYNDNIITYVDNTYTSDKGYETHLEGALKKGYKEITFDQFKQYVLKDNVQTVKNEFKKGDYIITLKIQNNRTDLHCGRNNYCFKQRVDNKSIYPEVDLKGSTTNGHEILSFNKKGWLKDWRYATEAEIAEYNRLGKPFDVTTLNTEPKSLVGRYLKAKVDYPWSIGNCKKGDYLVIINSTQCYKVKDTGKNKWIYANASTNYLPHQDFELMPEGFTPETEVKSEVPKYVICISKLHGLEVGKVYPVIENSVIDGKYNSYIWSDKSCFMPSNKDYYDLQNSSVKISSDEPVINTYGLKVGDFLPNAVINEWGNAGSNYSGSSKVWQKLIPNYLGGRKIEEFEVIDGIVGFKVSGSATYLKAEGFKEFMENFNKSENWIPKVGEWVVITQSGGGTDPKDIGLVCKIVSTAAKGIYSTYTIEIDKDKIGNFDRYLSPNVIRKALPHEIPTETSKTDIMTEDKFDSLFKDSEEEFKVGDWIIVNAGITEDSLRFNGECKKIIGSYENFIVVENGITGLWKKTNKFGYKQEFRKATPEEIAKATGKSVIPESYLQYPVKPSEAYKEKIAPVDMLNKYQQTPVIYSGKKVKSKIVTIFN